MPRITPSKLDTDDLASRLSTRESLNVSRIANWSSSNVTTTDKVNLLSVSHVSKTGKVLVIGNAEITTSGKTSGLEIHRGGTQLADSITNVTAQLVRCTVCVAADATKNVSTNFYLKMAAQDSTVTATNRAYTTRELVVIDI